MKEIVHFSTPEFFREGKLITSPFQFPESRIISDSSTIKQTVAQLRESVPGEQLRTQLTEQYSKEHGTSVNEFFLYQNLEFDTKRYSHKSAENPQIASMLRELAIALRDQFESAVRSIRMPAGTYAAS